jgi:hypothetical protein
LPAPVAAGPAVTAILWIAAAGYVRVHSSPAGSDPATDTIFRFRETDIPGVTDAESRARFDCPKPAETRINRKMPALTACLKSFQDDELLRNPAPL